jgi:hypothetical protein
LAKVRVEYAENAQKIEESEPRVGQTNSGVTAGTRLKSGGTRTETALLQRLSPGGSVESKSLLIGPTSNSETSPETPSVGIFGDEPVCIVRTLLRVMPEMRERLQRSSFGDLEIVRAGSGAHKTLYLAKMSYTCGMNDLAKS